MIFLPDMIDEDVKWANHRELVVADFDLETTGLDVYGDETSIVQFCCRLSKNNVEIDLMNILVNPEHHIPEEASRVHKIYDQDVKDKPVFAQVWQDMAEFMNRADVYCAYNGLNYDLPLLHTMMKRIGEDPDEHFNKPMIDPLVFFRHDKESMKKSTLMDAGRRYTVPSLAGVVRGDDSLHNALTDVRILADVRWAASMEAIPWSLYETIKVQLAVFKTHEAYFQKLYAKKGRVSVLDKVGIEY